MLKHLFLLILFIGSVGVVTAGETGKFLLASPEKLTTMNVSLARTPEQWRAGISGFPEFSDENGVLMVFPGERVQTVATEDFTASVDIIFINRYSRVMAVISDAEPGRYYAVTDPGIAVLLVPGGFCDRNRIIRGTGVQLDEQAMRPREHRDDFSEEIAQAAEKLQENVRLYPNDPAMVEMLAEFYLENKMSDKAEQILRDLIQREETVQRLNGLGRVLAGQRKFEEAIGYFKRAFERDPTSEISCRNIVQIMTVQGDVDRAIEYLKETVKQYPEQIAIQLDLARIYLSQNALIDAENLMQKLMESATSEPEVYRLRGDLYLRNQQYTEAAESYLEFLKLRPYDARANEYRAFITVHLLRKAHSQ